MSTDERPAGPPIVGIDLGTTNSAIGLYVNGQVTLFKNPLDDVLTPSAVALDEVDGRWVVGRTARDLIARAPARGQLRWKPDMGRDVPRRLGDRSLTATELSAHVLDALKADAERALGHSVVRCVITVPAYFDDAQRHATQTAAQMAGFHVERILNEPTAAAIAYGLHQRTDDCAFAVVDLGGGTFDVCVMEMFEGILQVKGVAGDGRLGGEDFTASLAALLARRAELPLPADGSLAAALLYKRAETAKRALSRWPSTDVELSADVTGGAPRTVQVSRDDAEAAWAPLLERLREPMRAALRGAGLAKEALRDIVLVGGATRMPCVQRAVAEYLGQAPKHHRDPDLLVAEGAAMQAAMLDGDAAVADMIVTDVASHSLGVDTCKDIGGQLVPGYFAPIIHRNTVIPTSRWDSFSTVSDYQKSVTFKVYEGEGRRVDENRLIGKLEIPLTPAPAGTELRVRFTYDQNGMLEVEVETARGKGAVSKVFHRAGGEVTGAALDSARARLRALRADPMDQPKHRDLMARAKLLWQEGNERDRPQLGFLLDEFERAIAGRNPDEIRHAFTALVNKCGALDGGDRW